MRLFGHTRHGTILSILTPSTQNFMFGRVITNIFFKFRQNVDSWALLQFPSEGLQFRAQRSEALSTFRRMCRLPSSRSTGSKQRTSGFLLPAAMNALM